MLGMLSQKLELRATDAEELEGLSKRVDMDKANNTHRLAAATALKSCLYLCRCTAEACMEIVDPATNTRRIINSPLNQDAYICIDCMQLKQQLKSAGVRGEEKVTQNECMYICKPCAVRCHSSHR
jgi:hypothetical protein